MSVCLFSLLPHFSVYLTFCLPLLVSGNEKKKSKQYSLAIFLGLFQTKSPKMFHASVVISKGFSDFSDIVDKASSDGNSSSS